jgi:hypothetical protein
MGKERRKEERYKIDASAEVKYGATTINVKAVEISKSGLRIQSSDFIEPGTKIEALLLMKEPKRISGEVKWAVAELGPAGVTYKIGIYCKSGELIKDDEVEALD